MIIRKKKCALGLANILVLLPLMGQPTGYYNGTAGLEGVELKIALHNIIDDHYSFNYDEAKNILAESDRDPSTDGNVILIYTGRSHDAWDYGIGGNDMNREHVWAKSHGGFGTTMPVGSDVHNLKPADASVNSDRSNLDFDNGGDQHSEATGCFYDHDSWEPRDEVKGDVARILFYMALRYEGDIDGEPDLQLVDYIGTKYTPKHGKLSTLIEWHRQDPPDEFERNRNETIFKWQNNRNPFVDYPAFAGLIFDQDSNDIIIRKVNLSKAILKKGDEVTVNWEVLSKKSTISKVEIKWGIDPDNLSEKSTINNTGLFYQADIGPFNDDGRYYYRIIAFDENAKKDSIQYTIEVVDVINDFADHVESRIYDVQGQQNQSPYVNQHIITSGIVTAATENGFFIQDGKGAWNGLFVYHPVDADFFNPHFYPPEGALVSVAGEVVEYNGLTELSYLDSVWINGYDSLPDPVDILTADVNSEKYEGVRVKVNDAVCMNKDLGYGLWEVNDGSGICYIHDNWIGFSPETDQSYSIVGAVNYSYSQFRIELTSMHDINVIQSASAKEMKKAFLKVLPDPFNKNIINIHTEFKIKDVKVFNMQGQVINIHFQCNGKKTIRLDAEGEFGVLLVYVELFNGDKECKKIII